MLTIWDFDNVENKHALCRGEDCMKKVYPTIVINFEKKKNAMVNKRAKIGSGCNSMLHLGKKDS